MNGIIDGKKTEDYTLLSAPEIVRLVTLAEINNPGEVHQPAERKVVIGFRRMEVGLDN